MMDILENSRIRELLDQAERAHRLRGDLAARSETTSELDEALEGIYRDLGRAFFDAVHDGSRSPLIPDSPEDDPTLFTSEIDSEDSGSWYTDEVELQVPQRLFDEDDIDDDYTDVPESDIEIPEQDEVAPVPAAYDVVTLATLRGRLDDRSDALSDLADTTRDPPTWAHKLWELLDMVELPTDFDDPQELAVEASKVQWAAGELETRLVSLPESVQIAIVGMLAARAQHLRNRIDVDVGPKLAIDRLRRYRLGVGLPAVGGLVAEPHPETGSWADDARGFWSVLQVRAKPSM